jgi:hypothetical protein
MSGSPLFYVKYLSQSRYPMNSDNLNMWTRSSLVGRNRTAVLVLMTEFLLLEVAEFLHRASLS